MIVYENPITTSTAGANYPATGAPLNGPFLAQLVGTVGSATATLQITYADSTGASADNWHDVYEFTAANDARLIDIPDGARYFLRLNVTGASGTSLNLAKY